MFACAAIDDFSIYIRNAAWRATQVENSRLADGHLYVLSMFFVFWWDIADLPNTQLIISLIIHNVGDYSDENNQFPQCARSPPRPFPQRSAPVHPLTSTSVLFFSIEVVYYLWYFVSGDTRTHVTRFCKSHARASWVLAEFVHNTDTCKATICKYLCQACN